MIYLLEEKFLTVIQGIYAMTCFGGILRVMSWLKS